MIVGRSRLSRNFNNAERRKRHAVSEESGQTMILLCSALSSAGSGESTHLDSEEDSGMWPDSDPCYDYLHPGVSFLTKMWRRMKGDL